MPTLFTHAFVAYGVNKIAPKFEGGKRCAMYSLICSVLPDIDVIGFGFGIKYGDVLGHRGLSHSLMFAFVLSVGLTFLLFSTKKYSSKDRLFVFILLFISTASHGVLDAFTNGGLGVGFFSPFENSRYFFSWQPMEASPINAIHFMSNHGLRVMVSEFVFVWLPMMVLILINKYWIRENHDQQ
ncbi:MAG: hypothetical protein COA79_11670 [Planctomycetota bacterium]|nr:MAG: hypothetical protein COA79_11670 [Planctomycetota bacterium]